MATRSTREVLEDHLQNRRRKALEADLQRNYAEDVVILSRYGVFEGHEGVRESGKLLQGHLPNATYHYDSTLDAGEMAFLQWSGDSDSAQVEDGADSFLIRDGRILVQTIHYTVTPKYLDPIRCHREAPSCRRTHAREDGLSFCRPYLVKRGGQRDTLASTASMAIR